MKQVIYTILAVLTGAIAIASDLHQNEKCEKKVYCCSPWKMTDREKERNERADEGYQLLEKAQGASMPLIYDSTYPKDLQQKILAHNSNCLVQMAENIKNESNNS